ncbi:MAG: hypothetical protein PVJ57_19145 [Phycisphaerae bacterium]|jgi:hypothetical protein
MSAISSATSALPAEVATAVAVKTLRMANDQQASALSLLEGALETAQQVQEQGLGEHVDVMA